MRLEVHVMEALSTATIDSALYSTMSAGVESAFTKSIIERTIPETEKGRGETDSKESETSNARSEEATASQEIKEAEAREYEQREYEERDAESQYYEKREYSTQKDLNEYYSKLAASNYVPADYSYADPFTTASEGVKQSTNALHQAMATALQKGMSIEDAVNIKSAKAAYEANLRSLKSTIEVSV